MNLVIAPTIIEESFRNTIWCNTIISGLKTSKKLKIKFVDTSIFSELEKNRIVIIVGSSNKFITTTVNQCLNHKLRPIIIGSEYNDINSFASCISINRRQAMSETINYLNSIGMNKIALLGINSYSHIDEEKKVEFLYQNQNTYGYNASKNIYYSNKGSDTCINSLINDIKKYDSVICSNDYFAIQFLIIAQKNNIKIPDDVLVIGFGNSFISEKFTPTISTISPNYYEMGKQAINTYFYLDNNPNVVNINTYVNYKIITRQSTKSIPIDINDIHKNENHSNSPSTFYDKNIKKLLILDHILSSTDETNEKIINGIINNVPYHVLAEKLYLSDTAFNYKLKKIFSLTNTKSKKELSAFLNEIFNKEV